MKSLRDRLIQAAYAVGDDPMLGTPEALVDAYLETDALQGMQAMTGGRPRGGYEHSKKPPPKQESPRIETRSAYMMKARQWCYRCEKPHDKHADGEGPDD